MGYDSNKLYFQIKGSLSGKTVSFEWNKEYSIGQEDNWGNNVSIEVKNPMKLTVSANRNSKEKDGADIPAKWYKGYVDYDGTKMIHTSTGDNLPSTLNFAIKGTLTIDGDAFEVCLGQGHHSSTNNWHLCSLDMDADTNSKGGYLGNKYYVDQADSNKFSIQIASDFSICHDNEFELVMKNGDAIEALSFDLDDYSVSDHQPLVSATGSAKGGVGIINVQAGRDKSEKVAKWFKTQVAEGAAIGDYTIDSFPKELNFAIRGTLKFTVSGETVTVPDFMLGQGSYKIELIIYNNNWWLGGPKMKGGQLSILGGRALQLCKASSPSFFELVLWRTDSNKNRMIMNFVKVPLD